MTFKYKAKEIQYSNKGFGKIYTNFVEIEILCKKCNNLFSSKF